MVFHILPLEHLTVQAKTTDKASVADFIEKDKTTEDDTKSPTDESFPLEEEEVEPIKRQFGFTDFFNLLFALFLVLMLLFVTLRFIKKKNQTYGLTKNMMNLGGTSLGGNRSVQLVKIGNRILVVGVGENIQLLIEIDSEEEVRQIISQQQNDVQQMLQPSAIFTKLFELAKDYRKKENKSQDNFKSILASHLSDLSKGRKKLLEELDQKGKKNNE